MNEHTLDEVIEYAKDLERELSSKDDVDSFNQAIMRLADAVSNIHVVDSFDEIQN